jgi:hypothetical protein
MEKSPDLRLRGRFPLQSDLQTSKLSPHSDRLTQLGRYFTTFQIVSFDYD